MLEEEEVEGDEIASSADETKKGASADYDPSQEDDDLKTNQKMKEALGESFGHKFTEDEMIHLAPAGLQTGFYIDPSTVDKSGRFRYMFCMDMNGYDEVDMVKSIRNLMDSDLMTNSKDGNKREAQFLDFGAHVLRISRDQFEDIITDPEKCKAWASSLGRTIDEIKNGFSGAENEKSEFVPEKYPEIVQITPDAAMESDLSSDPTKADVISGKAAVDESQFTGVSGGI